MKHEPNYGNWCLVQVLAFSVAINDSVKMGLNKAVSKKVMVALFAEQDVRPTSRNIKAGHIMCTSFTKLYPNWTST